MPLDPRIPLVTDILGVRFDIREAPNMVARERNRGACYHSEAHIDIDPMSSTDTQCETYWHEVMHAVAAALGVELTEQDVASLGRGTFQVLRANKLAFAEHEQQKKQQYCPCCTRPIEECKCKE